MQHVSKQRLGKYVPAENNTSTTIAERCFLLSPPRSYIARTPGRLSAHPCGGGVEYLHRDPESRRRRRDGKSQIWDSKIWSRVPRDSDPTKIALARTRSNCKRQTRPLVREGAPQKQDRNCLWVINIWLWSPDRTRHQDLLTVSRNLTLTWTPAVQSSSVQFSSVQFSSRKLEDSRIRQEDVVQGRSVVDVLTLRVL
jgi:hypothetical protein